MLANSETRSCLSMHPIHGIGIQPQTVESQGFSKLSLEERYQRLIDAGALTHEDALQLQNGKMLSMDVAGSMIENVVGRMEMPMGVAVGVPVGQKEYVVPMCVEETSIIAAVCKTSTLIREHGSTTVEILGRDITGQIQFPVVSDYDTAHRTIMHYAPQMLAEANKHIAGSMAARGGGVTSIEVRGIARPDGKTMMIVHVHMNPCDSMGANIITQVCEFLRGPLEDCTSEKSNMCIVSNLADRRLVQSTVLLHGIESDVAQGIEEASLFAELDPYRAATHNKGIMNGIDPILVATGNDWRAVEAGAHAYAAQSGQYRGLSTWTAGEVRNGKRSLFGSLTLPMTVGTVGGATRIHPTAQIALTLMDIQSADELAAVATTVGLIQNLGALHALTTDGLVKGHMRLHLANIIADTDATSGEKAALKVHLQEFLTTHGKVTVTDACNELRKLRMKKNGRGD